MSKKYRLEPLLRIKARARRQAEIALAKAIAHLEEEKKRKEELEDEKQELLDIKKEVRTELDQRISTAASTIHESQSYIDYMRRLDEDVKQKERDIERQEEVIEDAQVVVGRARRDYIDAVKEHKMMEKHKELWEKKIAKEIDAREQRELDELGQVVHQITQKAG